MGDPKATAGKANLQTEPGGEPAGFLVDLQIPNRVLLLFLLVGGMIIGLMGGTPQSIGLALPVALAMEILALVGWWLEGRRSRANSWLLVIGLGIIVIMMRQILPGPLSYAFVLLPVMAALAILGRGAALGAAGIASLFIVTSVLLPAKWGGGLEVQSALALLVLLWFVFGLQLAVFGRVRNVTGYAWTQYQDAVRLLDEARAQQARLFQTTRDLVAVTQQLSVMNERLAAARRVAEEAQKAKTAFVANVSHEFRTPLNMIIGLTDLLVENPQVYGRRLPHELLEDLEIVRRNSEHLSAMINDVLDLSQVEAGRLALKKERVSLARIIERAAIVVQPLIQKKALSFEVLLSPDLPDVYCDLNRVRQVIVNLLSNAARFTEYGGITVKVEQLSHDVLVAVRDTGPGITPEDLQKLFVPFSQGEQGLAEGRQSSGLGLAISRQFVELHGGRMWVESHPGEGSTFFFRLPISPPIEGDQAGPGATVASRLVENWTWYERAAPANLPVQPASPRVIVYDPGGDFYSLLNRYANEADYVQVDSLDEILTNIRRIPAQAVLVNSPTLAALYPALDRLLLNLPDVPVFGFNFPPRASQALAAGAAGYLSKPVTRAQLAEALQNAPRRLDGAPPRRVLLVDDHQDELSLLRRMILATDSTLDIQTASSGRETLEQLRQSAQANNPFDLVLLDIIMGDMTGWQVLVAKNQDALICDTPVIILSGRDPMDKPLTTPLLVAGRMEGLAVGQALSGLKALNEIFNRSEA